MATQAAALDLTKETEAYKQFVVEQIDQLVTDTEKFVGY
ncbi:TPA: EfeM/EfeO family lipoprotein, partial [Mannheimia haemolytica]|nr:EfeM/EfeO family lipoprotein [Mannheimia haemolytica]